MQNLSSNILKLCKFVKKVTGVQKHMHAAAMCKVIEFRYICERVFITFQVFEGYDGNSLLHSN